MDRQAQKEEKRRPRRRERKCAEKIGGIGQNGKERGIFFFSSCDGVENNLLLKVALSSHECSVPYILVVYLLLL